MSGQRGQLRHMVPPWVVRAAQGPPEHHGLGRHARRLVAAVRPRPEPRCRLCPARRRPFQRDRRGPGPDRLRDRRHRRPGDLGQGLFAIGPSWHHRAHRASSTSSRGFFGPGHPRSAPVPSSRSRRRPPPPVWAGRRGPFQRVRNRDRAGTTLPSCWGRTSGQRRMDQRRARRRGWAVPRPRSAGG